MTFEQPFRYWEEYNPEKERIRALAEAANERKLRVADALREMVGAPDVIGQYFMIGTQQSEKFHGATFGFAHYYRRGVPSWQYLEKPDQVKKVLVVSKIAKVAIISALFGNINQNRPEESVNRFGDTSKPSRPQSRLDSIVTSQPRPHYGWTPDPFEEEGIALHAIPELINCAPQLSGYVDVVHYASCYGEAEPIPRFGVGVYNLRVGAITVATVNILGQDLPEIEPIRYPKPIN
jgi:hypothetical protein